MMLNWTRGSLCGRSSSGKTREALREMQADRARLVASIRSLHDQIEWLQSSRA